MARRCGGGPFHPGKNFPKGGELTRQTFFRALQSIGSFRGECRVYVWLCRMAENA